MTGFGMSILGRAISQGGTDTSLFGKLGNAWTNYLRGKLQAKSMRLQGDMYGVQADEYDRQAEDYMRIAGDAQLAGRQRAEIRGLQLGQDIGRIYAGAAGSGIDVSSATVGNVERGMRREAATDIDAISANAAGEANSAIYSASAARTSAIWARADQQMAYLNSKWAKHSSKLGLFGDILSTVGWHMGQTSQNWS